MAATEILLAGHSHLHALAGRRETETPALRELQPGVLALDGPWPRGDDYWTRLAAEAPGRKLALCWEGNEHNAMFLFQGAEPFDFVYKPLPGLLEGAQIVTQATLRHRFRRSVDRLGALLTILGEAGAAGLVVLGSPPPKRETERLREMVAREPFFQRRAEALGAAPDAVVFTDAFVRLKLWRLLQDLYREAAEKAGGTFVAVPAPTQDADGFLLAEFWANDVTHANHAYGRLLLAKALEEMAA